MAARLPDTFTHGLLEKPPDVTLGHADRAPAIPGAEGRHALEIVRALYHSARTGAAVSLPFADDA